MRTVRFTYPEPQLLNSSPGSPGAGGTFFFCLFHKRDVVRSTGKSRGQVHPPCGREGVRGGQTYPSVGTTWSPPV